MEKFLNKKYKLDHADEHLDDLLKEMGINALARKAAKAMSTTVQLVKKSDDEFSLDSTILFFKASQVFTPGIGKSVTTADGRKVINTFTFEDDNKLLEKQVGSDMKTLTILREYFDDEMIVTSTMGDVVCKSWCKLVE